MTDARTRIERRATAFRAIRTFFEQQGFLEVDTPMLVPGPGLEPHIDPLAVTVRLDFDDRGQTRWLHTSPELALKRALATGIPQLYQMGRVFRDGERTKRHLPEFTMLEWYRAPGTLDELQADLAGLFDAVCVAAGTTAGAVGLGGPFEVKSVAELFEAHAGIDLDDALTRMKCGEPGALVRDVCAAGHMLRQGADFEDAFVHIMASCIEPNIGQTRPTVVTRWPAQMAVLARTCVDDPRYAERFEIYAQNLELANAFDELTDPVEQRTRFEADNAQRAAMGKPALPLDEAFLADLGALPRSAGIALGVDRLLMIAFGATTIDDVEGIAWR